MARWNLVVHLWGCRKGRVSLRSDRFCSSLTLIGGESQNDAPKMEGATYLPSSDCITHEPEESFGKGRRDLYSDRLANAQRPDLFCDMGIINDFVTSIFGKDGHTKRFHFRGGQCLIWQKLAGLESACLCSDWDKILERVVFRGRKSARELSL